MRKLEHVRERESVYLRERERLRVIKSACKCESVCVRERVKKKRLCEKKRVRVCANKERLCT